jgi:hypothetical protein
MADPQRWLVDGDAPEVALQLLRAIEVPTPPSLAKQAELAQRLATLAAGPGLAAVAASTWWKLGLVSGGLVSGAALLLALLHSLSAEPDATASRPAKVEAVAFTPSALSTPRVAQVPEAPQVPQATDPAFTASDAAAERRRTSHTARSTHKAHRDTLAEEEALLERARGLTSHAPGGAWQLLEKHRQLFPAGQLVAERMSLGVDVLERLGKARAAHTQAEALMRQFPGSVYAVQLQQRLRAAQ